MGGRKLIILLVPKIVSGARDPLFRTLMLVFGGITSLSLLIASIALLIWVTCAVKPAQRQPPADEVVAIGDPKPPAGAGTPAHPDAPGTAPATAGVLAGWNQDRPGHLQPDVQRPERGRVRDRREDERPDGAAHQRGPVAAAGHHNAVELG